MRILLAGASGALGTRLTRGLVAAGHTVIGLSRTPANRDRLSALGAQPVIADVLDQGALQRATDGLTADAVISQLTQLKKVPVRHADLWATDRLRTEGTANLLAVARAVGARRFVTQSMIFGYGFGDLGERALTEADPFAPAGRGGFERHLAALREGERQVLRADGIEGIALRYGLFYGSGAGTEEMVEMLRRRRLPVPKTSAVSMIYIEDACAATIAALARGRAGEAYNVVDDEPVSWRAFLTAVAAAFGVPKPVTVPAWLLRPLPYAHAIMTARCRVSAAKAKQELGWAPSAPTYREGLAAAAG